MPPDRRARTRFLLELKVHYTSIHRIHRRVLTGYGSTRVLFSTHIAFTADQHLLLGMTLQMRIAWPASLESGQRLNFVVVGPIVRSDGLTVVVKIRRHDFRTRPGPLSSDT